MSEPKPITRRQAIKYGLLGGITAVLGKEVLCWAGGKFDEWACPYLEPKFEVTILSPEKLAHDFPERPSNFTITPTPSNPREREAAQKYRGQYISIGCERGISTSSQDNPQIDLYLGNRKILNQGQISDFPVFIERWQYGTMRPEFTFVATSFGESRKLTFNPVFLGNKELLEKVIEKYKGIDARERKLEDKTILEYPRSARIEDGSVAYNICGLECLTNMNQRDFNIFWQYHRRN